MKLKIFSLKFYSKPVIVGTIYHPPSQNNFLELLNSNMNKINLVENEIFILGDFNINLILTFWKKEYLEQQVNSK